MNEQHALAPPRSAAAVVGGIVGTLENSSLIGDLEEEYRSIARLKGRRRADIWYWGQIIASLPAVFKISLVWSMVMLKNYFKITLRNIMKHKGYAFLNIAGLALGLAGAILISLWVLDETSYDTFHEKGSSLYRVEFDQNYSGKFFHVVVTPYPLAPAINEALPEVVNATRYFRVGEFLVKAGDKVFYEDRGRVVDPSFFQMFTFPVVEGDVFAALSAPDSLVLTESAAARYFGEENPLGKTVNINNRKDVVVGAVIEDPPDNSDFRLEVLIPYAYILASGFEEVWTYNAIVTFVELAPGHDPEAVAPNIQGIVESHMDQIGDVTFSLLPVRDLHLESYFGFEKPGGAARYVRIFSIAAAIVLLIACINFMNLATARSSRRAREVGLRKVVGARRGQVIAQFFGESVVFSFLALFFASGLVVLFLPVFNRLAGKDIGANALVSWPILPGLGILAILVGLLAGSYPALVLSSFRPVRVLKGLVRGETRGAAFRRILVVAQFAASVGLIIGTAVVYRQVDFMRGWSPGFDKDQVVSIPIKGQIGESFRALKTSLLQDSRILEVTAATNKPSAIGSNSDGVDWEGKDPAWELSTNFTSVDADYPETIGVPLVEGRGYIPGSMPAEPEFVINETLARLIADGPVVGTPFSYGGPRGRIIGVVEDFHFDSLRAEIEPLVILRGSEDSFRFILVRLDSKNIREGLDVLSTTWERILPDYPLEYAFLNTDFDEMYRAEERMGGVLRAFAAFAVIIACLGLFGLAAFAAEQRTKEIGIRKVLGASVPEVIALLCREFLLLIGLANLIAAPASLFIMKDWLARFAYRTGVDVLLFLGIFVLSLAIGLLTVVSQAFRAASVNPAKSLRYE